ncbi:MAG: biotin--[acetyl-CoA-carboxylase] ligase [Arenicellales bacterium]|jgi:BirA family biotin operon repressor/biotin-[acetyl-CoA-carboxylase] ligase
MEGVRHRLLKCLNQHEFRTGTEIGTALGLSRAAIHNHVRTLVARGVPIHRVPGRGYRLAEGVVLLDESAITGRLSERARGLLDGMEVLEEVDSTSAHVLRNIDSRPLGGRVCLAERQTAGHGRRGRAWVASPYRDLVMSIGVDYPQWPPALPTLGLVTGLSIIKALESLGAQGLKLKWPNDVLYGRRKLCGLLLDVSAEAQSACRIVVGVGINVSMDPGLARGIDQPWVDLETVTGRPFDRNVLAARCLDVLLPAFESFPADGFSPYRSEWKRLDALCDRSVTVRSAGGVVVNGRATGVDGSGRLQVVGEDGDVHAFTQGEVSVRPR